MYITLNEETIKQKKNAVLSDPKDGCDATDKAMLCAVKYTNFYFDQEQARIQI